MTGLHPILSSDWSAYLSSSPYVHDTALTVKVFNTILESLISMSGLCSITEGEETWWSSLKSPTNSSTSTCSHSTRLSNLVIFTFHFTLCYKYSEIFCISRLKCSAFQLLLFICFGFSFGMFGLVFSVCVATHTFVE